MVRSAVSKIMWVGRVTVFTLALAVALVLVVVAGTTKPAEAATPPGLLAAPR